MKTKALLLAVIGLGVLSAAPSYANDRYQDSKYENRSSSERTEIRRSYRNLDCSKDELRNSQECSQYNRGSYQRSSMKRTDIPEGRIEAAMDINSSSPGGQGSGIGSGSECSEHRADF